MSSPSLETRSRPSSVKCGEHCHGAGESRGADNQAADKLRRQHLHAAAVEQASESFGRFGDDRRHSEWTRTGRGVLAAGEQAQRKRSPDTARAVNRPGADRIVDAAVLEQVHRQNDDHTRHRADEAAPNPLTQ